MSRITLAILAILVACSLGGTGQPINGLDRVEPRSRPVLMTRAKHCYKMPNGEIWDGWMYAQYRDAIDKCLKRVSITQQQGMRVIKIRDDWQIANEQLAKAWEISTRGLGLLSDSHPPLWFNLRTSMKQCPFLYFNEKRPDKFTEIQKPQGVPQYTKVVKDWGDGVYEISMLFPAMGHGGVRTVRIDSASRVKGDSLTGEFFLWPDRSIEHPDPTIREKKDHRSVVYTVIDAADLRLTVTELLDAIEAKEVELFDWSVSRGAGSDPVWSRKRVEIHLKPKSPSSP